MNNIRGRPARGGPDRRERIRREARALFLASGYRATTMRSIAAAAEVDVALLGYYFRSKQELFAASVALPLQPARVLQGAVREDSARLADRLLHSVLMMWENPAMRAAMREFIGIAMTDPALLRAFREYIEREVVDALEAHLVGSHAHSRAIAAVQVVVGLVFSRYILALEPFASAPAREAYRTLRPVVSAALAPSL